MTSLLPNFFCFADSVVLGLVCRLSPPQSHFSKGEDFTAFGAEAPLPPRVLRDIPDETVKALVDCPVIIVLLAMAEGSIEQPVVNGFLMGELGNFKDTMKMVCSDVRMEDSLVYTKCCAVLQRSRAKDDKIST